MSRTRTMHDQSLKDRFARFTEVPGADPVNNPAQATNTQRTKRAWILLLLTALIPGGAQVVAGNKRLGRFGLRIWLTFWLLALIVVVLAFVKRDLLIYAAANSVAQMIAVVILVILAIIWAILWIDTFRLTKFHLLAPGMKTAVALATVIGMLATSGTLVGAALMINSSRDSLANIFGNGPAIEAVDGRYNFLILGADAGEGREGLRPDSISVASINAKTGKIYLFSIPRNFQNAQFKEGSPLWPVYPNGYDCGDECIINALYTDVVNNHADLYPDAEDPGAAATMDAASGILNLDIQGYVMLDMGGFAELIDSMGGVTVTTGGWTPYRGPRPDGQWGTAWWGPDTYTFSGDDALGFARSRVYSSDYARIRRQQCVQQAMLSQFDLGTLLTRFEDILAAGEQIVETNIPHRQLGTFLSLGAKSQDQQMERLTIGAPDFGSQGDRFSTYPDFGQIHDRVGKMLAEDGTPLSAQGTQVAPLLWSPLILQDVAGDETTGKEKGDGKAQNPEDWPAVPTRPNGEDFDAEYLMNVEDIGDISTLEHAASTNQYCHPG